MSKTLKIVAYGVLVLCAILLGVAFFRNYSLVMAPPSSDPLPEKPQAAGETTSVHSRRVSQMMMYGAGLFLVVIGAGLLASHDLTHYFADRIEELIFDDQGEAIKSPEYDHAEQVWADGKFLEAIQLMRDHLKEHPREQFVALRIAEIYEKDLGNHLAAALEYEEILKKKLPPEKWGWTAIHLANLYSGRLNKVKEAEALLRRIADDYGQTAAAKKARERLGIPEPVVETPPEPEPESAAPPPSVEDQMAELQAQLQRTPAEQEGTDPGTPPAPEKSEPKLPPGFRPKA